MVFGRVYTIRSHQTTELYIGSTTQALSMRMAGHRRNYKSYLNKNQEYITSFKIVQYPDAYIELLFEAEFESKDLLRKKEGEYIRSMECVNRCIAGRTTEEYQRQYRVDNKEKIKEYKIQYGVDNKEKIKEYQVQYQTENKDIIKTQRRQYYDKTRDNILEYQTQYRDEHKEQISEYHKQYRDEHKEELAEQRKQKITCECGSVCRIYEKARHERTLKHQNFLKNK